MFRLRAAATPSAREVGLLAIGAGAGAAFGLSVATRPSISQPSNERSNHGSHVAVASDRDEVADDVMLRLQAMEKKFEQLQPHAGRMSHDMVGRVVDKYVDDWYERNRGEVDVGVIDLPFINKQVDLLPDHVEKHIYATMFKAMVGNILDTEVTIAGVRMKMEPLETVTPVVA